MKTRTAIATHVALGGVQVGAFASGAQAGLPWWAQLLIQLGLSALQAWTAHANSNSDQAGNTIPPPPK